MIQKKICLLGAFSVGKTSLIKRFVESIFSEKYLTTIGVKIDKKTVEYQGVEVKLMIWDLEGEDDYSKIKPMHLRGAAGYILVIDGTRPNTLKVALSIHEVVKDQLGDIPLVVALNKSDLKADWELSQEESKELSNRFTVFETSAKSGQSVDELFTNLSMQML